MIASDYIVEFLISKGITDVFGYPGGMVTYLMDSISKYENKISSHLCYHEQAASFAACGYAQVSGKPGIAFATSGPGATNMVTGIANAFFDSIPCIFITGQVNTYEQKGNLGVRQKGFQETDLIHMMKDITKYAVKIEDASELPHELEKAYRCCLDGRPGPVLIDIPMNVQRQVLQINEYAELISESSANSVVDVTRQILDYLKSAKRPVIIAGAGIRSSGMRSEFRALIDSLKVPVVSSMIAVDVLPSECVYNKGFIGAYGNRLANFIVAKSDLIITLGTRLDCRQTGVDKSKFAEHSKIVRIDIDPGEMTNRIKDSEIDYICDLRELIPEMVAQASNEQYLFNDWLSTISQIKKMIDVNDELLPNEIIKKISRAVPENSIITTDVGQNQVWVSQSFEVMEGQTIIYSGGHGAMGYSLPAAVGAYYGAQKSQTIVSFSGDGGFQMNLQELQFIIREQVPLKIFIINNKSLGMIRHFQEMYFNSNDIQTVEGNGYSTPDFNKIANAYGVSYTKIHDLSELNTLRDLLLDLEPRIFEVIFDMPTYVFPKVSMGNPIQNQDPLLTEETYNKIMSL